MTVSDASIAARTARRHARTFALAARLLPAQKRRGAFGVYAFCRTVDDLVDETGDGRPETGETAFAEFLADVDRCLRDGSDSPVLRELRWAVDRFGIPRRLIDELLAGVARDLAPVQPATWGELERYCAGVASSVGEMCTHVFGVEDAEHHRRAVPYARSLGVAMQLTNILRDVGEDAARGRCYLPADELARVGLAPRDVLERRIDPSSDAWQSLMRLESERARTLYRAAIPGISLLAPDARRCALACATGYAAILDSLEANAFDSFSARAHVRFSRRARILAAAIAGRAHGPTWLDATPAPIAPPTAESSPAT
jgi:15-cis-phytoene synthase